MNIHFKDEDLYHSLIKNTCTQFKVGAHIYALENENSDIDFLNIYLENSQNRNSFLWEHHQLQFKKHNIDYNFTTLQGFIRNILVGDATINMEVLFSEQMKYSSLNWLWKMRHSFINYNIIRSYLGMAKRDLKDWRKDTFNGVKASFKTNKKLTHFLRGVIFADMLMDGNLVINMKNTQYHSNWQLLNSIKNTGHSNALDIVKSYENKMNELRKLLNFKSKSNLISKYMSTSDLRQLDFNLQSFLSIDLNLETIDYGNLFYEVLEYGISY